MGLSSVSLDRHRDAIDAEIAQAETFRDLLKPAVKTLEALSDCSGESVGVRRSGWTFDTLLPYLVRDWSNTTELEAANSIIGTALEHVVSDPSGKSVAFAGCGAGGLLAGISSSFHVLGFDLTLPILAAARHLLDGKSLDLVLPRSMHEQGRISLRKRDLESPSSHIELIAMDGLDTAFADGSIDCVITSFLLDLVPNPRRLADEIHRILSDNGVWVNYGPTGPPKALWRFDQRESLTFFEPAGFTVIEGAEYRTTYLDLSRDCPTWSFKSHMCYLTSAQKTRQRGKTSRRAMPDAAELPDIIPRHFPGAKMIEEESLWEEQRRTILLRHQGIPGHVTSLQIETDTARIMRFVDGQRTVQEIADLVKRGAPDQLVEQTIHAFGRYFSQGLLSWRDQAQ